jgi:hypothetical protein
MAFSDEVSSYSQSSSSSSSDGGISVSVSGGIATIQTGDGKTFRIPCTTGRVSSYSINGKMFVTVDGKSYRIPSQEETEQILSEVKKEAYPIALIAQSGQATSQDFATGGARIGLAISKLKEIVDNPLTDPQSRANATSALEYLQKIQNRFLTLQILMGGGSVPPVSEVPVTTPEEIYDTTETVVGPVKEVTPEEEVVSIPEVQKAGLLPEKIFGIPTWALGLAGVGLFLFKGKQIKGALS